MKEVEVITSVLIEVEVEATVDVVESAAIVGIEQTVVETRRPLHHRHRNIDSHVVIMQIVIYI